jgi:ArsR family transcriptional regulator
MKELTRAARALSDEIRLRILNILSLKECCVCEVMQALEISQSRASRNLRILDDAGFLNMRTDGLYTIYSLDNAGASSFCSDLLKAIKIAMKSNETAKIDALRLKKSWRIRPGCFSLARESPVI